MNQLKKKLSGYDLCFLVCLPFLLIFLLWKCRYGYGAGDEPFYLTLAQRFAGGDALLCEEWNLSQLSGFLLMPFYKLYYAVTGSTEGIVLHFRYVYVLVQTLICFLLYLQLRKYRYGAFAAILLFFVYTPYDIMALSYNTMGLMGMALCLTLLSCGKTQKPFVPMASGFCFAAAVLCNPYLISLYLLYVLVFAALHIGAAVLKKHGKKTSLHTLLPIKELLFFTLGAGILAVLFMIFLFSRAGLPDILRNLTEMLNDPEHTSRSLYSVVYSYFFTLTHTFKNFLLAWAVVLVIALTDRNKYKNSWMYFCMTALLTAIAVLTRIPSIQTDYNYIMFPAAAFGFTAYLLTQKKNHRIFLRFFCPGILYTFCLGWASNQGDNAICMGMPVVLLAGVLLIWEFLTENSALGGRYTRPLTVCMALLLFCSQFGTECYAKSVHAFWEPSVSELDTRLEEGPLKGLYTTKGHADFYTARLKELQGYPDREGTLLIISSSPWCYLYAERPYGTYSSWITTFSSSDGKDARTLLLERLERYYELHPDKLPEEIYITDLNIWNFSDLSGAEVCELFTVTYSVTASEQGFHLVRSSP